MFVEILKIPIDGIQVGSLLDIEVSSSRFGGRAPLFNREATLNGRLVAAFCPRQHLELVRRS